jgi:trimeric autotransporter adhesin
MTFDEADMANMEANGTLTPVILHEMGHVLGIGTNWGSLLQNPAPAPDVGDPTFVGVNAQWTFPFLGTGYGGAIVPVENCCGSGTRNAHWRESILVRELMTGFITGGGGINPISPLTSASLLDQGYVVDVNQSDLPPSFLRSQASERGTRIQIREELLPSPIMTDLFGRIVSGGLLRAPVPPRPPPLNR